MKKILIVIACLFIPYHFIYAQDLEDFMSGFHSDYIITTRIQGNEKTLVVVDKRPVDFNDYIYSFSYFVKALDFYHQDSGWEPIPLLFMTPIYNGKVEATSLAEFFQAPENEKLWVFEPTIELMRLDYESQLEGTLYYEKKTEKEHSLIRWIDSVISGSVERNNK